MLVRNLNEVKEFLDILFPEGLKEEEVIIFQCIARRKYWNKLPTPQISVAKKICCSKENFLMKLLTVGSMTYFTGQLEAIPHSALGLYIVPFPRNLVLAVKSVVGEFADALYEYFKGNPSRIYKANQFLFSALSKQSSYPCFLVDVDRKDRGLLKKIAEMFSKEDVLLTLETRGGYHMLVKKGKETFKAVEKIKQTFPEVEIKNKHYSIPVPGTLQGGFEVRLIKEV